MVWVGVAKDFTSHISDQIGLENTDAVSKNLNEIRSYAFKNGKIDAYNDLFILSNNFTDYIKVIKINSYPHFLDIMAILFFLNALIMIVIGKFSPREEVFVLEYTKAVDITPWKYTKQARILICAVVIFVYYYFA